MRLRTTLLLISIVVSMYMYVRGDSTEEEKEDYEDVQNGYCAARLPF